MLTGFTWCVPLKIKTAGEVASAYKNHIACPFGGSVKILTDNGTEFMNKEVVATIQATEQWEDRRIPQIPQSLHREAYQPWIGMG